MQKRGISEKEIKKELLKYYSENYKYRDGTILSSMSSEPESIAVWANSRFIESNLGNPYLFPGTKKVEEKVIKGIGELLHNKNAYGRVLSGGTESNITALWAAKKLKKEKNTVIVSKAAHFSVVKAADLLNLNLEIVPLTDNYVIDYSIVKETNPDDVMAIIGIAGTTEYGTVDPIDKLADFARKYNIFLHVDAAFGGFIIPFLKMLGYKLPNFDFEIEGVNSISIDPHKMGLSTIGAGALLFKDNYFDLISFSSEYLTSKISTTLLGTRSSGNVAAAYAVMRKMGMEGYKRMVKNCYQNTLYMYDMLQEKNIDVLLKPVMNIINIKTESSEKIANRLKPKWMVGYNKYDNLLRIVVMPHITKPIINDFLRDLEREMRRVGWKNTT
ncbi:MAG: tyrosine decarboxylase MfnA [Thermoplasmata archaeon]